MTTLLLIWIALAIVVLWCQSRGGAGLPVAYFFGLSLIHVPGAILYLDDTDFSSMAIDTKVGFAQTVIGLTTFLIGVIFAKNWRLRSVRRRAIRASASIDQRRLKRLGGVSTLYISIGAIVYFVFMSLLGGIPSITAILSSLGSLIVVGVCLRIWVARQENNSFKLWSSIALIPLFPLITTVQQGFIGFGMYWAIFCVCFLFAQSKRRLAYIVATPFILFVGLSVWVTYAAARDEIRQVVWQGQASMIDRVELVMNAFGKFEWLDLSNAMHRKVIDLRLNQNFFVGRAVARLDGGEVDYGFGSTVGNVFAIVVPRALWPDKPVVGGGGTVVRDFTGLELAEGTSFGAGNVFEFYVNFGIIGVIVGFFIYGAIFGTIDVILIDQLRNADGRYFLFLVLVAISLLSSGANMREIIVSAAGSAATAYCLGTILRRNADVYDRQQKRFV
jgi:hypothetical protein